MATEAPITVLAEITELHSNSDFRFLVSDFVLVWSFEVWGMLYGLRKQKSFRPKGEIYII